MATRARELLDRSRVLLDRSRDVAAQFLSTTPRSTELTRQPVERREPEHRAVEHRPSEAAEALVGVCTSVAMRDLNLVDSLLSQLEEMESREDNEDRLAELYRLDHLATRLRRNAENLRVLASRDSGDDTSETTSLVDTVRAAMSAIDNYERITIGRVVSLGVVGFAAEDLSRVLAELLDNAANQSPPATLVRVSAHLTEQGSVLIRIEDEGIGLPAARLQVLNDRLTADPVLDNDSVRHMGLAVVRRLADRHGMRARLDARSPHGTTATLLLPSALVCELAEDRWSGGHTVVFPQTGRSRSSYAPAAAEPELTAAGLPKRSPSATATVAPEPVPEPASPPAPAEVSGATGDTPASPSPLPRRRPTPIQPIGGLTPNGLPRRVSRSIKESAGDPAEQAPAKDETAGHEQLIADLGAFSAGQQEALDEQQDKGTQR